MSTHAHAHMALLITFRFPPVSSVSSTLFSIFNCVEFATSTTTSSFFVASDLSLSCSLAGHKNPDYDNARAVALGLIFVWPIMLPLSFSALLFRCRTALRNQRHDTLTRSLNFLHRECE